MEITLKRKYDASSREPLIIMLDPDEDMPAEKRAKVVIKMAIGETKDFPDEIAYQIMGKYKGCFEIKNQHEDARTYKTKIAKPEIA